MKKTRKGTLCLLAAGLLLSLFALANLCFRAPVLEYVVSGASLSGDNTRLALERMVEAKDTAAETLGDCVRVMAVGGSRNGVSISAGSTSETATVYAAGDGWFEVYPSFLLEGRLITAQEQKDAEKVIVLDEELAFKLFGSEDPLDRKVSVGASEYRVTGVTRYRRSVGQQDQYTAWIPFLTTEIALDTVTLSAVPEPNSGAAVMFESASAAFAPEGCFYNSEKEVMRQTMVLRLLLLMGGMAIMLSLLKWLNHFTMNALDKLHQRLSEDYMKRLFPWVLGGILAGIAAYGLWVGVVYLLLDYSIQPLYLFTEWIPENLVEWKAWKNVFWNLQNEQHRPILFTTRLLNEIRFYGILLRWGTALCMTALLLRGLKSRIESKLKS